ncbi:gp2 [Salmonella enterica subsp. enterica]|uniref:Gp2 n=1 Tax=Salmonella enterica I TaxID=59201 RepID=A0A447N5Q4_SALET|nr:gp2 [Salmonella enterica subsp. enterica]
MKNNVFSQSQIQAMADILHNDSFDYQATWVAGRKTQYRPQHY